MITRTFYLASLLVLLVASSVHATTYYIDDAGSDAANGTTTGTPWLTWAKAFSAATACGDTLIVMDGTYTTTTHGNPSLTRVCTAGNEFTIQAQNSRQATISGNGSGDSFTVINSAYIIVDGLRIRSTDLQGSSTGTPLRVQSSNHITIKRIVADHNNRYANSPIAQNTFITDSLYEDVEIYYYHRHGIILTNSNNNVIRRTYCNSRGYADISGGYTSGWPTLGDSCVGIYPGSGNIAENVISEGQLSGFEIEALGTAQNNLFIGDISINDMYGYNFKARGSGSTFMPRNMQITQTAVITPVNVGIYARGNFNTRCDGCLVYDPQTYDGINADVEAVYPGDGTYSFYSTNALVFSAPRWGLGMGISVFSHDHPNMYSNLVNYNPATPDARYLTPTTVDPALGTCRVWIPDASPMKGAGLNGADIGANILYRYQNGVLTETPLWDVSTGAFPCGATVAGLNDTAGNSCNNVHERLNINMNGCSFPSGYGTQQEPTPPGAITQTKFRFEEFNSPEVSPHLRPHDGVALNTNSTVAQGGKIRVRIKIAADADITPGDRVFTFYYSKNGGAATAIPESCGADNIAYAGLADVVGGNATTEQMTSDQSGVAAGAIVRNTPSFQTNLPISSDVEYLVMLKVCAGATVSDTYDIKARQIDSSQVVSDLDAYPAVPRFTVVPMSAGGGF